MSGSVSLPYVFANLNGGVPASYLDANFNAIANGTNGLSISGFGSQIINGTTGNQVGLFFNYTNAQTNLVPIYMEYNPVSDRGAGYQGFSDIVVAGTISQNPDTSGSRFDTELESIQLTVQTTSNSQTPGHSAIGVHVTKQLPAFANGSLYSFGAATLPSVWTFYGTAVDSTGLPTSVAGHVACAELDMKVNAIDDAGDRGGYTFNADNATSVANGGKPATVAQGFYSFGLSDAWIWCAFRVVGNHIMSGLDTRGRTSPSTTVLSNSTGTTVAVTNVTPFLIGSSYIGQGVNYANDPIYNVSIGSAGNTYQVVGAVQGAGGTKSGTLTLSSSLLGTDGNAGSAVSRPFYPIIMATGDKIAFDVNGNTGIFYDSTVFGGAGGLHVFGTNLYVSSQLQVIGQLMATGAVSASGTSQFANLQVNGTLTPNNGLLLTGGFLGATSFTVAALPNPGVAPQNALVWASNGCKPGETTGNGTGVLVCRNAGASAWLVLNTTTAVSS